MALVVSYGNGAWQNYAKSERAAVYRIAPTRHDNSVHANTWGRPPGASGRRQARGPPG